jgi:hypothetical protein
MSDTKRITWADSGHATEQGSVGGISLFAISWRLKRTGKDWILTARLPGVLDSLGDFDTTDEAKAKAEAVLVAFVEKLGAKF